jgi:GNAT superfamily N-acetyltransferase
LAGSSRKAQTTTTSTSFPEHSTSLLTAAPSPSDQPITTLRNVGNSTYPTSLRDGNGECYKTFLHCAAKNIRSHEGVITARQNLTLVLWTVENWRMIRCCDERDFELIWSIINDGARAYQGVIPADCWTEPYMSSDELRAEIDKGVTSWGCQDHEMLAGVMGIQQVEDVTLIRHAYVRASCQKQGVGGRLLAHLRKLACGPVLIGTWTDAVWAIRFYEKHGFHVVAPQEKQRLLKRYWKVPDRQAETSVVLADSTWHRVGRE